MCNWNGVFADPSTRHCCRKGFYSEYCVDASYNKCSPYFSEQPRGFLESCPSVVTPVCGTDSPILEVKSEEQTFELPEQAEESCYYVIGIPEGKFPDATKVSLTFTSIEGVALSLLGASTNIKNKT